MRQGCLSSAPAGEQLPPSRMRSLSCSCSVPWEHLAAWQQDRVPWGCQHSLFANRVRVQCSLWLWNRSIWSQMNPRALGWGCKAGWELQWRVHLLGVTMEPAGPSRKAAGRGSTLFWSSLGKGVKTAQLGAAKRPTLSLKSFCSPCSARCRHSDVSPSSILRG